MLWIFVQKVERAKQLYFGFDEGFHGLVRKTFHFVVHSKNSRFKNLGLGLFKKWFGNLGKVY